MNDYTKEDAIKDTRELLLGLENKTIYAVLRHVSKSGMMRAVSLKIIKNDQLYNLDYKVEVVTGRKPNRRYGGVKVIGCGMDMGFHVVDGLMHTLDIKDWQKQFHFTWI